MAFNLKSIVPKAFWGLQHNAERLDGILPVSDHEVIFAVGSRLAVLDYAESNKSKLTYLGPKKVEEVLFIALSADLKYVAASIKIQGSNATMLIHQIDKQGVSPFRSPRQLQHAASSSYDGISFSSDSALIAAFTDVQTEGILIYDRVKEALVRSVNIGSPVTAVSFNPEDSSRLCTTGALLQFWRYTAKAIHNAPIAGLQNRSCAYTCHAWLPDRRVVVGTDAGELVVVHQSSVQSIHLAFGSADQYNYETEGRVIAVLADERHVVAASSCKSIGVFEIIKLIANTGTVSSVNSQSALSLKAKFKLGAGVGDIRGIQLNMKSNPQSESKVIVVTQTSMSSFELCGEASEGLEALRTGRPSSASLTRTNANNTLNNTNNTMVEIEWVDLPGKSIYSFHGSRIDSLCCATRSSSFVTSSTKDNTVRIWDCSKPFSSSDVTEDFADHKKDMPVKIDMHPSGWTVACATRESVVCEFAVTLSGLSPVRQVVAARIPFVSSDGTSYANSSPVSLLKFAQGGHILTYAHGGHLLAVVCGKLIQLFHLYDLDYSRSEISSEKQGKPKRVMTIAGHGSTINDLVFSSDDCTIYSCSTDGTVYSHAVSVVPAATPIPFIGEYVTRGGVALKVVTSPSGIVIVYYEGGDSRVSMGGYLAIWQGGVLSDTPMLVQLDAPIRDIALSTVYGSSSGDSDEDVCLMGGADGSVLVSFLPLPTTTKVLNIPGSSLSQEFTAQSEADSVTEQPSSAQGQNRESRFAQSRKNSSLHDINSKGASVDDFNPDLVTFIFLDVNKCKAFYLHCGPVSSVVISADGNRMFSTGEDGAVFMLAVSRPTKTVIGDVEEDSPPAVISRLEEPLGESALMLADKKSFARLRSQTSEMRLVMEDRLRDSEKAFVKLSEQTEVRVTELETRLKREVSKRDAIILNERENHRKQKLQLNDEIASFERKQAEIVARVELGYEQKLAQEALYLDRMRQAYEEMALHTRLDKKKARDSVIELQLKETAEAALNGKMDAAKQKEALLSYVGYVNARHEEILSSLEKGQEKERVRHKKETATFTQLLEEAKTEEIKKETVSNRLTSQLTMEVAAKEDHLLRMKNDLDWAEGRVERLEAALMQATGELKKRTDMYEKWEFKAGDQQQQISEMERIRKALTVQIHGLRQEIGPKEEKLLLISEKLQEMDREYDLALKAVSDKEVLLGQKSAALYMLQKQVRDLRSVSANKDASLRRAALLFEQYRQTLGGPEAFSLSLSMDRTMDRGAMGGAMDRGFPSGADKGSLDRGLGGLDRGDRGFPMSAASTFNGKQMSMLASKINSPMPSRAGTMRLNPSGGPGLGGGPGGGGGGGAMRERKDHAFASRTLDDPARSDNIIALQRLNDVLRPHLVGGDSVSGDIGAATGDDDSETVLAHHEKEKQVKQLHKNVNALKGNLERAQMLSELKAKNQLSDNEHLLKEVNEMRHEIRQLSIDNHRLKADLYEATRKKKVRAVLSATLSSKRPKSKGMDRPDWPEGPEGTEGLGGPGWGPGGPGGQGGPDGVDHEGEGVRYFSPPQGHVSPMRSMSPPIHRPIEGYSDGYSEVKEVRESSNNANMTADQKISALMSLNDTAIRAERGEKTGERTERTERTDRTERSADKREKDIRAMSDDSAVSAASTTAQDILLYHKTHGNVPSQSYQAHLTPSAPSQTSSQVHQANLVEKVEGGRALSVSSVKSAGSNLTNHTNHTNHTNQTLKLNTTSIHLPAVIKQSARVAR